MHHRPPRVRRYEAELKPYIDRLNAASGLVECQKAEALARRLLQESAEVVMLTDRFTRQQLEEVRIRLGKERDAVHQLSKWKKRGYVVVDQVDVNLYVKSEKYKKRIDN